MDLYHKYFRTITNPNIDKINETINLHNLELISVIGKINRLNHDCGDPYTNYSEAQICLPDIQRWQQIAKVYEDRITELIKLRQQLQKHELSEIICAFCDKEEKGLEIPGSPIKICLRCIYSTVLEHQTKKLWAKDSEKQTEP